MFPEERFPTPITPHCTDLLVHEILLKMYSELKSIHYLTAKTISGFSMGVFTYSLEMLYWS